jgi:hypothetical protein
MGFWQDTASYFEDDEHFLRGVGDFKYIKLEPYSIEVDDE